MRSPFRQQDCYFEADCPICEHRLRLRYVYYFGDGVAEEPEIIDAGACNCLLGPEWCQEALDAYLMHKYTPDAEDFI